LAQGVAEASLDAINSARVESTAGTHHGGSPSLPSSPWTGRGEREVAGEARRLPPRVMITAHGASDGKRAVSRERGFRVVDVTCPLDPARAHATQTARHRWLLPGCDRQGRARRGPR